MDKVERIEAVLAGRPPDRPPVSFWYHFGPGARPPPRAGACASPPPVSFWYHFGPGAVSGPEAVGAHLRHLETYDLDFLKVMDDNRYPRTFNRSGVLSDAEGLDRLRVLNGDEDTFGRQLELIRRLARRCAGQVRLPTTVFNSWTTLRHLTGPEPRHHGAPPPAEGPNPRDVLLARFLREAPAALARALAVIAESLANFARHALAAGADGVFLSVRDDWVDTPENGSGTYDRLVQPGDRQVLAASAGGAFNVLHVCGRAVDFRRFAAYPVQALNWADRSAGPAVADAAGWVGPAVCAGLDHVGTMARGAPEDCAREVANAVRQAGGRPLLIAPGCTYDSAAVPPENLHAIRRAVEALTSRPRT